MFSAEVIAALAVGAALALVIPIAAAVVFKLKNRETWLPSLFIGAGTFIVFALVLEQLLHAVMIPIIKDNAILYSVYGALAAGIFEETGRLVAYKTLMRKHYTTKNAVLMGLGHGGIEAIIALGLTLTMLLVLAVMSNSMGIDKTLEIIANGNSEIAQTPLEAQLESIRDYNFASMATGVYERIIALTFHTCMSVVVYKSVSQKGKIWLYPTAIVLHALLDFPAAMYQTGIITSIPVVYAIMTVFAAAVVFGTVILAKKLPDKAVQ
ncbi:MAG: YhfC family intramembrane metalloprotease [Ruminococcaceae bacterium]|nr:YhfC family intramembrane metalloprotease [Oscillospiraceae bacterium]